MADPHRVIGDDAWVEFKPSGYPFRLSRQLKESTRENEILETIIPYVVSCHLPKLDGNWIEKVEKTGDLDDIDEQIVVEIIRAFYDFRQERMYSPIPKNS